MTEREMECGAQQGRVIDAQPASAAFAELRRLLKDALPWLELLDADDVLLSALDDPDRAELRRVIRLVQLEVDP